MMDAAQVKALVDRSSYPGLMPEEVPVLRAWLAAHAAEWDSMEFNVRVGPGVDPGPTYSVEERAWAVTNSQRRLDALAKRPGLWAVVEAKVRAGASVMGQLLVYRSLVLSLQDSPQVVSLVCVCQQVPEEIRVAMYSYGIEVVRVVPLQSVLTGS